MKEFFKKSTVYQNFKSEEDKELTDRQECLETQDEIQDYEDKYTDLKSKVQSLQAIMFSQQNKKDAPTATDIKNEMDTISNRNFKYPGVEPAPKD